MTRTFDLIVIGSGAAAGNVASLCRAAGWTVAMIDKRPFGGTCALRGCDPKKVLVGAASAVDGALALSGKGVRPAGLAIDWPSLMQFRRTFTDPYPDKRKADLTRAGIEVFQDVARFVGPTRLSAGDATLEATRAIVIAAGARPGDLRIPGCEHVVTSDAFLDLPSMPPSLIFIGGGYISFEFAHVAARADARATILHRGPNPLASFDRDLVERLVVRTRALGVDVRLNAEVRAVEVAAGRRRVALREDGRDVVVEGDLVVHGAGRVPDLDDLDLTTGEVDASGEGVSVNQFLQSTSNPRVYAAGDCAATGAPRLTPVAAYEGRIVAANLLEGNRATPDYAAVPSVVFTIPPLARVGLTEDEARRRGLRFVVRHEDTSTWNSSRRAGETASAFKVLVEEESGQIIGAHLLGPHADETINLFALAMRNGVTADRFRQTLWAYPTNGSDTGYMV